MRSLLLLLTLVLRAVMGQHQRDSLASYSSSFSPSVTDHYEQICQQAEQSLDARVESLIADIPSLSQTARLKEEMEKMEEYIKIFIESVPYAFGIIFILIGQVLTGGSTFPLNSLGFLTAEVPGYWYELVAEFELLEEDCTAGGFVAPQPVSRRYDHGGWGLLYDSDRASYAASNVSSAGRVTPEQYWIAVTRRVETIRDGLDCVSDDQSVETQFKLIEKVAKLRTKLLQEKNKIY